MPVKNTTPNLWNLTSPAEVAKVISFILPVFAGLSMTGHFSWLTAINAVIGILGALAILHSSNNPYVKAGLAVITAGLQAVAVLLTTHADFAGATSQDWWTVIGAALGAVGVLYVPNKVTPPVEADSSYTQNVYSQN